MNIESNLTRVGIPLANPNPQRGDVVTFRNPSGYKYHGGIVTGVQAIPFAPGNELITFIHSSSSLGPVQSSFNMNTPSYYQSRFHSFYRP